MEHFIKGPNLNAITSLLLSACRTNHVA